MRLCEYFHDTGSSDDALEDDDMMYKKESSWTPGAGRDKWLDAYITAVKDDVISGLRKKIKLNMSCDKEQAMQQLLNADDIVIRPADKGSGIVVMDKKTYGAYGPMVLRPSNNSSMWETRYTREFNSSSVVQMTR